VPGRCDPGAGRSGTGPAALRGIIHAAGVVDDGTLLRQNWDRFEKVMAPKVSGTWHLHGATRHLPLDFFVLFSSVFRCSGMRDRAITRRQTRLWMVLRLTPRAGLAATSINWGAWAEVGMAADRNLVEARKVSTFTPQEGLQALEWALQHNVTSSGRAAADWNEILRSFASGAEPALYRLSRINCGKKQSKQKQGARRFL